MRTQRSNPALPAKLRPKKVRNAIRRRWFERRVSRYPLRDTPGLVKLGGTYGGWTVPGGLIEPSWICYSIGAGGNIEFDLELIRRYGLTVRSFDAVAGYVEDAIEHAAGARGFSAHHAAIATVDGPLSMQLTHDPSSRSVSSAGLYETTTFVELPGRTLKSLMNELGDDRIDLLKLDVEGAEYELLPTISLRDLGVKIFATELHHTGTLRDAWRLIARVQEEGYEPVAIHTIAKITFAARDLLQPITTYSRPAK
jgi:FkbM family methyltransferase